MDSSPGVDPSELERIAFGLSAAELARNSTAFDAFQEEARRPSEAPGSSTLEAASLSPREPVIVAPTTEPSGNEVQLAPVLSLAAFALLIVVSVVYKYVLRYRQSRQARYRDGVGLDGDLVRVGMETRASRFRGILMASSSASDERCNVLPPSANRARSNFSRALKEADMAAYLTVGHSPSLVEDLRRGDRPSDLLALKLSSSSNSSSSDLNNSGN